MYMEPCIPLPLEQEVLDDVVDKARDWALMHGVGMRRKDNFSKDSLSFAPFLLLPSTFPRTEFERSLRLQTVLNELVHRVAHDYEFLHQSLSNACKVDEFTRRLFEIYEAVRKEGGAQSLSLGLVRSDLMLESGCLKGSACKRHRNVPRGPYCCWKQVEVNTIASGFGWLGPEVSMGLLRSDYFFDEPRNSVKQVEINTIASSFGALSTVLVHAHRYILAELGHQDKLEHLPDNNALQGLCGGMLKAWSIYGRESAAILFIIEDVTYNICDQRFHEFEIRKMNPKVKVIRKNLTEVGMKGSIDSERRLFIDDVEVAVIYFRSGYAPEQYHSDLEWSARLLMERSLAIKSPSIHYHLAGSKKVQQELARPGVLEKYLNNSEDIESIQGIFTGLFSLDRNEAGDQALNMALQNPNNYVLKPQREGGGNNIYGEEIKEFLMKIKDSDERSAWILMEKISPPLQRNYMIRPTLKEPMFTDVVSELGVFGVIIGDSTNVLVNELSGHMLRTKVCSANEGGVASGLGALDSVYLEDFSGNPA
ncbi:Glutathione synthetase [Orchesella cincta]|uniref:Glutathione synthetase n=1 Tax=Orchesella cincta TaxID=48709 RepID=A0A1D2NJ49_ORCCI|nr:Glutathione synthetase [Orchesella cincta]